LFAIAISLLLAAQTPEAPSDTLRWRLSPDLRIGSRDAPDYSLTRVGSLAVGADGAIYVGQPEESLIRVFDREGHFERVLGRPGAGPGEFRRLNGMGWLGDTLWAIDGRLQHVNMFVGGETLVRTITKAEPVDPTARRWQPGYRIQALLVNGRAVAWATSPTRPDGPEVALVLLDAEGQVLDTLAVENGGKASLIVATPRGSSVSNLQPFNDNPLWKVAADGSGLVIVERPAATERNTRHFLVVKMSASQDTAFMRERPYDPVPIAREVKDSVAAWVAGIYHGHGIFGTLAAAEAAVREALYLPDFYPPVTRVVLGRDQSVWLEREAVPGKPSVWEVLDANGRLVGIVQAQKDLEIREAQFDRIWGVERDELDVPYVVRYLVVPGGQ